uniref:Response regulatory domain-containing protein n=1 Tax=Musa acuminata subsp. malaccensis TaxID=214687 RepID=A0A804JM94_MUSAM
MPEMTGYDLLKAVMEQSCQKPIPVIVMSSENEPQRINSFLLEPRISSSNPSKLMTF